MRTRIVAVFVWLAVGLIAEAAAQEIVREDKALGVKYSSVSKGEVVRVTLETRDTRYVATINHQRGVVKVQSLSPTDATLVVPVTAADIETCKALSAKLEGDLDSREMDALQSLMGLVVAHGAGGEGIDVDTINKTNKTDKNES